MKDFMKLVYISHIPTQHNHRLCCSCKQWNVWILNQSFNYQSCHSPPWHFFCPSKFPTAIAAKFSNSYSQDFPREQKLFIKQWLSLGAEVREALFWQLAQFLFLSCIFFHRDSNILKKLQLKRKTLTDTHTFQPNFWGYPYLLSLPSPFSFFLQC
jgi:hypothetical protein